MSITAANQRSQSVKTCELVLTHFTAQFDNHDLARFSQEKMVDFLFALTKSNT